MIGFTYNKEHDVLAWQRHILAGNQARVMDVACIPGPSRDELWIISRRVVQGNNVLYIERLDPDFEPASPQDKAQAFFVDCGLSRNGAPTSLVTELTHLVGETVAILADGAVQPNQIVYPTGTVSVNPPASVVHVGLPYIARFRSLRPEAGANHGTSQTKLGRVHRLGVRLFNTLGLKFGSDFGAVEELQFRKTYHSMDQSPPLFTGDAIVEFPGDFDRDRQVVLLSDQPYPCTITSIVPQLVVNE